MVTTVSFTFPTSEVRPIIPFLPTEALGCSGKSSAALFPSRLLYGPRREVAHPWIGILAKACENGDGLSGLSAVVAERLRRRGANAGAWVLKGTDELVDADPEMSQVPRGRLSHKVVRVCQALQIQTLESTLVGKPEHRNGHRHARRSSVQK